VILIRAAGIAVACVAALACAQSGGRLGGDGRYAMGTVLEITLPASQTGELERVFERAAQLDEIFTRFDPGSDLSRLNRDAGRGERSVPRDLAQLLDDAIGFSRLTQGSFDVTVGPLVNLWSRAAKRGKKPTRAELATARALVGTRHLRADPKRARAELLRPGVSVDLDGVAKGYALDVLGDELRARGVRSALLSFGQSSVRALGPPPEGPGWRMLIRDASDGVAGTISLRDRSLSISGSLSQALVIDGVRYGHLIDPRSGRPLMRRGMAAVTSGSGAQAEALSKALLILEPAEGLALIESLPEAEGLLLGADGSKQMTSGWTEVTRFQSAPAYSIR